MKLRVCISVALVLAFAGSQKSFAHAILVRSTPASHSVVHGSHLQIVLHFNSRIDASRSTLTLTNAAGKAQSIKTAVPAGPAELDAYADGLSPAHYFLHWQALATDGHITRGQIPFTVQ